MAKLKTDPITQADLQEFLQCQSDFAFELRVLESLSDHGFLFEHGGTYTDPVTGKMRQFDIRATGEHGDQFLRLAVECKNIRSHCPLLISCVPRREEESFHEILVSVDPERYPLEQTSGPFIAATCQHAKCFRMTRGHSLYREGDPVGKSIDQVGRNSNDEVTSVDSEIYDKWSQALCSAHELTELAQNDGYERDGIIAFSLVFPIVVIPDERLWVVQFDNSGRRTHDPTPVDRCSFFVGRCYSQTSPGESDLTISHLEFVTLKGLVRLVDALCGNEDRVNATFNREHVKSLIAQELHM